MRPLKRFLHDERANIVVMAALAMTVAIGATALTVDVGKLYIDRRQAQSIADLAAVSAAGDISNAQAAAVATIQSNGWSSGSLTSLTTGIYTADTTIAPSQRFQPASPSLSNAVSLTITRSRPLFFGRVFGGSDSATIQTNATATQTGFAAFEIGSGLASLNNGLINQILGGLTGSNLSLSVMDYQALLSGNVELFNFMNMLATRINLTGATYSSLLSSNVRIGDFVNAMIDSGSASGSISTQGVAALQAIASAVGGSATTVPLQALLNVGPYSAMPFAQVPQPDVAVSALNLLMMSAELANGAHQVQLDTAVTVPGIVSSTLSLTVGEPPHGTSWLTVGPTGASVHTAQTRLLLTVQLAAAAPLATVTLPVYVELASGTATLTALSCGYPDISSSSVTLGVVPGVLDGWIGAVTPAMMTNFTSEPNPAAATLVSVPLVVSVGGRAQAAIDNLTPTSVPFSYADITSATAKTVSTQDFVASLLSQLIGNLTLNVTLLGLPLSLPGGPQSAVATVVAEAAAPLDQLLSTVLSTLGISLGQATVTVTGLRCDGAVLVR